ncbi:MAG TPA: molybdopterin converting factor subunit 1 [Lacipirellula sp.]
MKVAVKLFAAARELAGETELAVELPDGADVAQLRASLAAKSPQLKPIADRSLIAVNSEYADQATVIRAGDEIALIPPVSGG